MRVPLQDLSKQHDLAVRLADVLGRDTRAVLEIPKARALLVTITTLADRIAEGKIVEPQLSKARDDLEKAEAALAVSLQTLLWKVDLGTVNEVYALEGLVGPYASMPTQHSDQLEADHQPQAGILQYAAQAKNAAGVKIFAGRVLEDVAGGGHADGGMTINLHLNRHRAGRTWGYKSRKTLPPAKGAIDSALKAGTESEQRDLVIAALRNELEDDVSAMNTVVGDKTNPKFWKDVFESKIAAEQKAPLIGRISDQVKAGEGRIKSQNLNRFKDKK